MQVMKALLAVFVVVVFTGFALLGLAQYRLSHARITETLVVVTAFPGASPMELEADVTDRIEKALSQVKGIESLRSTSGSDLSVVTAQVTVIGVESEPPSMLAQQALNGVVKELPRDVAPPSIQRVELQPVTRHFIARSETMTRLQLSRFLDEVFRRKVEVQSGVRQIEFCGAVEPELEIRLDPEKLRALGVPPEDVVTELQHFSISLPSGRINDGRVALRVEDKLSLEDLQNLQVRPQVRLSDVAMLQRTGEPGDCTTANDVLVSVSVSPNTELKLPDAEYPAGLELKPFTPVRMAVYLSAPGNSVTAALRELGRAHPGAVITAQGETLTVLFAEEPRLVDVPGLALRSLDDRHAIVQVIGPDFEQLTKLGDQLSDQLAKAQPRWLGTAWPRMRPEQVIKARPGVTGIAQALQLAMGGVSVGQLEDGSSVRVYSGSSLEDASLPDGRPVRSEVEVIASFAPSAILRVNRERVVELEVGLEIDAVKRVSEAFQLPAGYRVTVIERN